MAEAPGERPYTVRTPRVSSALKLHRRRERDRAGLFLAEGPQAVREALLAGVVREVFVTPSSLPLLGELTADVSARSGDGGMIMDAYGVRASIVDDHAMAALAETVTPQGIVAMCEQIDVALDAALAKSPQLVAVLVHPRDPGNAGTILRTSDAAGAQAVVFAGDAVDPYNGKCVRASAGSLFHVDIVRERDIEKVMRALRGNLRALATSGRGESNLFDLDLAGPTAWLFGGEAHGLPGELLEQAERVRVPIYGMAESLNLASAAAVCLYASAHAQNSRGAV
jgi:RNA methyltransferase, TrmH family